MSDAAVATICGTLITIVTLWLRVKYGEGVMEGKVKAVEGKVDHNTTITTDAKDAAHKAVEHTEKCDEDRARILQKLSDHDTRISALETEIGALKTEISLVKVSVDNVDRNISRAHHEMRGYMQTVTNKLDLLAITGVTKPVAPAAGG